MDALSTAASVTGEQDLLTAIGLRSRCTFLQYSVGGLSCNISHPLSSEWSARQVDTFAQQPITVFLPISTGDRFSTYAGVAPLPLRNARRSDESAVEKSNYSRRLTTIFGQLQSLAVREWPWIRG